MFSQPCRLLFLALLLAAGFFNSVVAQSTVPKDVAFTNYQNVSFLTSECGGSLHTTWGNTSGDDPIAALERYRSAMEGTSWTWTLVSGPTVCGNYTNPAVTASYEVRRVSDGSLYGISTRTAVLNNPFTDYKCPETHPIDNGDGTCSTDAAHEEFCQGLADEGHTYWDTQDGLTCAVVSEGNPQGYACAYQRDSVGIGFGGDEPQFEFTATGQTCSGEVGDGTGSGGSTPLDPSTPVNGDDLNTSGGGSGGSAPGTDPTAPTGDDSSTYLGEKFAFETRTQTKELLEGMAGQVNETNLNRDKNSKFIVEALEELAKVNSQGLGDVEDAVKASGSGSGSGSGDPAGWSNEEDVSIDALDCVPDPITGRCTNWAPLTEQELPEKIINLDNEIAQFDEYSVTATCPDTLDMDLSFGAFEFNSKPVCDTLGGVRYLLLALAYFLVARVVTRSMV